MHKDPTFKVWQPRFYESIIHNDRMLQTAREYIKENPLRWWRRSHPNQA